MKKLLLAAAFVFAALLCLPTHVEAQQLSSEALSITDTACTLAAPCTVQIYRAVGTCPASGIGTLTYTPLTSTLIASTLGDTSSNFTYTDATIAVGTSYVYYATVTYQAGGVASPASAAYCINVPVPTPSAPTITGSPF